MKKTSDGFGLLPEEVNPAYFQILFHRYKCIENCSTVIRSIHFLQKIQRLIIHADWVVIRFILMMNYLRVKTGGTPSRKDRRTE